jgi:hypothetical protein
MLRTLTKVTLCASIAQLAWGSRSVGGYTALCPHTSEEANVMLSLHHPGAHLPLCLCGEWA